MAEVPSNSDQDEGSERAGCEHKELLQFPPPPIPGVTAVHVEVILPGRRSQTSRDRLVGKARVSFFFTSLFSFRGRLGSEGKMVVLCSVRCM